MDLFRIFVFCFFAAIISFANANHRLGQTFSTSSRTLRNVGRRLRIPSSTSPRVDSGFSTRRRQSAVPQQRIRIHPTSRTSSQIFRTRSGHLRLRTSSPTTSRSSNVRFGRVVNRDSRSRPVNTISHVPRRAATTSNTESNRMISIPKSLLLSLLQNARQLGSNSNSRRIEQPTAPPVTQPTVHLTVQGSGLANSISNTIGSQLENLLNWNQAQNVLDTTAQQRLPSIPSSLAFQPLIEEPFGNDPQYLILPSMSPPDLFATQPAPTYIPSQFDLALQAHILDELGLEHLIKDTPDASEVKQPKPKKKAAKRKKTQIVINTNNQNNAKNNAQNTPNNPHTNNNGNNNNNNNNQGLQQVVAQARSTTMKPIRIVLNNFQQTAAALNHGTTPAPGPINVNQNQKLIITPSGNYTIQQIPLSNSGFQIA